MGGAKRYPSPRARGLMGIASLHPSYDRHSFAISRRVAPEVFHFVSPPQKQRAQGRPGARCTRGLVCKVRKQKRTRAYRFSGEHPAFPAQWLYGLLRALPGERLFCHRRHAESGLRNLTPAPRRQDHTTSPYARATLVSRSSRVHRISPRVRDVRTPLSSGETGGIKPVICPTTKAEYFCREHWTAFADLPVGLLCRMWRRQI